MDLINTIEQKMMPVQRTIDFEVGDTVKVHYKIIEGNRERIQIYEGVVIAIDNKGINKTFTVRRISYDIGVERVFPVFSPRIAQIDVTRKSMVKRAKLYYLRERKGKSAKLKEKRIINTKSEQKVSIPVTQTMPTEATEKITETESTSE